MADLITADSRAEPNEELPVTVYTPESQLRSPGRLLRSMWHDLLASRELAWRLMVRDIKAKYRQSLLGIFWVFVPPVAIALIFIVMNRAGVMNFGETDIPYPAFVLFGTTLWYVFADSIAAPLKAITQSKAMLVRVNFPREAIVLSALGQSLFDLGVRLIILAVVFIIFQIPLTWGLLLAPLAILMLLLFGTMIGILLIPIGALYTDITSALPTVTNIWLFATPVIYPPPQSWPYSLVVDLNPVSPLLVGARDLATRGTLADPLAFAIVSGLTIIGLLVVWVVFRVSLPILVERMGA